MAETLFPTQVRETGGAAREPLAARMRPRRLDEVAGQDHLLGPGRLLRRAIEADRLTSIVLWGPPGAGKTSLARVIAETTSREFVPLSGVVSTVADLRRETASARNRIQTSGRRTILFIDEIHRFNRAQQDVLLPHVEQGTVALVGATTHNPFFYLTAPLVSRSMIFALRPIGIDAAIAILQRALADGEHGLGGNVHATAEALEHWARVCDGDARRALNALELAALTTLPGEDGIVRIDLQAAEESIQQKAVVYDSDEDGHYDTISAFIKSMRGSDPDAAVYWLAKMLHAGEDPRFIARRIMICAAEDVGNADPQALVVAAAAAQTVDAIGMPEARIPLAQAAVYVAVSPKSNAAYKAIETALDDVRTGRTLEVPRHLRGAGYRGAERLGHGEGYKYAHDFDGHHVAQDYLPEFRRYYEPADQGYERQIARRLAAWRAAAEPPPS